MPLFSTPTFAPLEGFPIVPDCYLSRFSSKDSVTSHFQVFFLHSVHRRRRRGAGSQCHHFPNFNGRLRVPLAHLRLLARALLGFRRIPEVANRWGSDCHLRICLSLTGAACRVVSILGLLCSSRVSSQLWSSPWTLQARSIQAILPVCRVPEPSGDVASFCTSIRASRTALLRGVMAERFQMSRFVWPSTHTWEMESKYMQADQRTHASRRGHMPKYTLTHQWKGGKYVDASGQYIQTRTPVESGKQTQAGDTPQPTHASGRQRIGRCWGKRGNVYVQDIS